MMNLEAHDTLIPQVVIYTGGTRDIHIKKQ